MSVQLFSDYSLVAVVLFVVIAGIVLSFCQQVENEATNSSTAKRP